MRNVHVQSGARMICLTSMCRSRQELSADRRDEAGYVSLLPIRWRWWHPLLVAGALMGLAKFFGRRKTGPAGKTMSPAAAAYAPMVLTPQGAAKLQEVMDPTSKTGKPTRQARAAL